ncbi:HDOD domain-containing protein [Neptuniibacter sp. 1_MG-2023]|uniref:HDOD domain-containing protein n=1 Tax=Neptuniibacter sp. 1_MG-2023 TaxID=3062662 RepID=UPI0026E341BF|nr:HDOD domain-containing protein [Neptuniibacter sp. 1_MG-2023]MDO6593915.1 HDOD domain-containing protein [Neptuniibacter sp. 1_MG-2023]
MFERIKAFFCGKPQLENASVFKAESSDKAQKSSELTLLESESYGFKSLDNARELSLTFVSSLLGVRALDSDESKEQERLLRASLDEELIGLSDESIPKLSKTALTLMADLLDSDTAQSKIITAIQEDPALAGKVISIANSPFFVSSDMEIKDLGHALSLLGAERLKKVVMSSLLADKFEVNSYYFETFGKALWAHSSEVAENARKIAIKVGANLNLSYFVGLIHDIGKLMIFKKLVELHSHESIEPHPQVFSHLLNDYSHALTRQACEFWALPEHWYQPILECQTAEPGDLKLPESMALFLGNHFAELHSLHQAGEITDFELVWRLTEVGSNIDEYQGLYSDSLKAEER